jgi:formylglycine-generating enzyme required for sulfatase activity
MKTKICIAGRLALIFGVLSLAGCDIFIKDAYNLFHSEDGSGLPPPLMELARMELVPAGKFWRDGAGTNISVIIEPFYMGIYPVTRALYFAVMKTDPSNTDVSTGRMKDPVQYLSWYDAVEFCNRLSRCLGKTPAYNISGRVHDNTGRITSATVSRASGNGYRLPTEMEWMWAAMGADRESSDMLGDVNVKGYQKEFAGDPNPDTPGDSPDEFVWYGDNGFFLYGNAEGKTHPVGLKRPNKLGLYDMSGNVFEWCQDQWDGGAYPPGSLSNYVGNSGTSRIYRGGSWYGDATRFAVASRGGTIGWISTVGFRVVCPDE